MKYVLRTSHVARGRKRQWCILCVCGALWLAVRIVVHMWVYMRNGMGGIGIRCAHDIGSPDCR